MQRILAYFAAFTGMGALFGGTLLLAALVLGGGPSPAPTEPAGAGSPTPGATGIRGDITIHAVDLAFQPSEVEVDQSGRYALTFVNDGALTHDITFDDGTQLTAEAGQTVSGEVDIPAGGIGFHCAVPGHAEAGMRGRVTVAGAVAGGAGASASPTAAPAQSPTVQEISRHPTDLPPSADYTLYQDGQASQPVQRDGPITIEVHFQIAEVVAEVLPGTTMDYWTFNGAIPGPMVRGEVGDTIDFYLTNPSDSKMPHDVDFHAVTGPGGGSVRLDTAPGATSHLRVKLLKPGIYIYHCAFPDIPTHIAHGMYGLVVVEPAGGLPPVDHEYYVMQSEFYTTAGAAQSVNQLENAGHLDYSVENGNLEEPTFVVFNGRPNAVTGDRAIGTYGEDVIRTGESIRLFVGNIGPNFISSFHVIGEMFDTVYVEGSFSLENHDVQTTLVPSGGAVGVELTAEVPGDYLMVDHSIFRLHKGAAGVIHVEGAPNPDVYDSVEYSDGLR